MISFLNVQGFRQMKSKLQQKFWVEYLMSIFQTIDFLIFYEKLILSNFNWSEQD
ncbi:unnamed protein product [Paramecium sonneborni]|uniref:Uncharacterized protein n=1 Tax=Paramecium sonneborni TaxID=65129 RepID=A0A8S1RN94_9CILI|nr:unnamed protein product [Paramecium sonneborni]